MKVFEPGDLVYIAIPEVWGDLTFYKGRYLFKNVGGHTVQMIDYYPVGPSEYQGGHSEKKESWWSIMGTPGDTQRADVSDHYIYPYGNINAIRILYGREAKKRKN